MNGHSLGITGLTRGIEEPLAQAWARNGSCRGKCLRGLLAIALPVCALAGRAQVAAGGNGYVSVEQDPAIRVWIINRARVDEKVLSTGLDTAERIFRRAGVRLTWVTCEAGSVQSVDPTECRGG